MSDSDLRAVERRTGLVARIGAWILALPSVLRDHLGLGRRVRPEPVRDVAALRHFLESRASYIAQTTLYGYLRTRAGMKYPALFDDDVFVVSINIAKWHMWLACLSDLAVFSGGLLVNRGAASARDAEELMAEMVTAILDDTGVPDEADHEFPAHAQRVRERIARVRWNTIPDSEEAFSESPSALVQWAPVVEEFKQLDAEIVRNSVRFHWNEVRRDLRQHLEAEAVMQSLAAERANQQAHGGGH